MTTDVHAPTPPRRTLKRTNWLSGYEVRIDGTVVGHVTPSNILAPRNPNVTIGQEWAAWTADKVRIKGRYPTIQVAAEAVLLHNEITAAATANARTGQKPGGAQRPAAEPAPAADREALRTVATLFGDPDAAPPAPGPR